MKEKLAEEAALKEGYYQSDKTQYTVTPWMDYNLFVKAFIAGWEAKEASIGGGEVKKRFECYEILQVRAGNRFNCSEQCNECKEEERLLNSPLTKEWDEGSMLVGYEHYADGQPCKGSACWAHKTKPCEYCGRIACRGEAKVPKKF